MSPTKRERYVGTLVGVLAGDAGGAPYENKKSTEILLDFENRGGLKLFDYVEPWKGKREIPAGHPTDDSELTAAFALSLSESKGFSARDVYRRLRQFIHGDYGNRVSFLTNGKAYGSGGTLRSALKAATYEESFKEFREGRVRIMPTNGALMRCAPAALVSRRILEIPILARDQSCITHINPLSQMACMFYAVMLYVLVTEEASPYGAYARAREIIEIIIFDRDGHDVLKEAAKAVLALDVYSPPNEAEIWPHSGEVMLSLRISVWALLHADNFLDGLTKSISVGGDVDTYGAIAGGLLGAHFGVRGIPQEWRDVLIGADIMERLAGELYDIAHL